MNRTWMLFLRSLLSPALLLALLCALAHAKPPAVNRIPAQTDKSTTVAYRVAIVPVIDISGEKEEQRRDQINAVQRETTDQFRQRGFQLVDSAEVERAISSLAIDFSDEEEHRRENVLKVGRAVNADYVIFTVVNNVYAKLRDTTVVENREGLAKTKTWLMDVQAGTPILSGFVWEGKSSGWNILFAKGNKGRMGAAAGNSIRDVLNEVLVNYPRAKSK